MAELQPVSLLCPLISWANNKVTFTYKYLFTYFNFLTMHIIIFFAEFNDDIHLIDREIKFHQIYDSSILIQDNFTSACNRSFTSGLCFMERPLQLQEKVHIRGLHWKYLIKQLTVVNIGLTDINPDTIHESEEKKQIIRDALKPVQYIDKQEDYYHWAIFHLCITLCPNATLSFCLKDTEEFKYHYQTVSDYHPLWLVIDLNGLDSIWISHV